jgi:3-oxoacyl-[acyl-carrier-protein] synthase-3
MTALRKVVIRAIDSELPALEVTDAALAAELGLDVAVVSSNSKGRARFESPDGEGPTALAARAATRLLASRGLEAKDVDFVVFATNTPDMFFPGSACLLQAALGCRTVGGLDVRSQCTGFLAALDTAWRFVATGMVDRLLLAAADTPSHFNARDGRDPQLSCAMGDGAAVVLLEAGEGTGQVLGIDVHNDGSRAEDYWCEYPASRHRDGADFPLRNRLPADKVAEGLHYPRADLDRMHEFALSRLPLSFAAALAKCGITRVDATLVAHLDPRVEETLPTLLGDAAGRIVTSDLLYCGGTSLPLLLSRSRASGALRSGETVALLTAGSGAGWGCGLVRVP